MPIPAEILAYNEAQPDPATCDKLARTIDRHLKGASAKIWHRHPVWFLDDNPIVGYSVTVLATAPGHRDRRRP